MNELAGKHILVGAGGGIAVYKIPELIRRLRAAGASVRPMPTRAALAFVTPMSFEAVAGTPCAVDVLAPENGHILHVEEAYKADAAVVAPATCNLLARLAHGMADEMLPATLLAFRGPLILAPSMESRMWEHEATQANLAVLKSRGALTVGPETGVLATGRSGAGRMADPLLIFRCVCAALRKKDWQGKRVLVTGGPTVEDLDPVRFLSNRSSGRMGIALAEAAAERGADAVLVHGPMAAAPCAWNTLRTVAVRSAAEMYEAVMREATGSDVAILAAAVSDFAPQRASASKIKKDRQSLSLTLEPTRDILASLGARADKPFLVGFAAETENLEDNARAKLQGKDCDAICANRVGKPDVGFESETNAITLFFRDGASECLPLQPKGDLAHGILDRILPRL